MVMQRMKGISISQIAALRAAARPSRLASSGVEVFYTQVFRDGFFHPTCTRHIMVAEDGPISRWNFGIMGTLTDSDKNYLAQNFIAFFAAITNASRSAYRVGLGTGQYQGGRA